MQVAGAFELAGVRERAGVQNVQAGALGDLTDLGLRLVVVGGDEDVERLARDLALDERAGERRVERLDDLRAPCLRGDLLARRAGVERCLLYTSPSPRD